MRLCLKSKHCKHCKIDLLSSIHSRYIIHIPGHKMSTVVGGWRSLPRETVPAADLITTLKCHVEAALAAALSSNSRTPTQPDKESGFCCAQRRRYAGHPESSRVLTLSSISSSWLIEKSKPSKRGSGARIYQFAAWICEFGI